MNSLDLVSTTQAAGITSAFISSGVFLASSVLAIHPLFPLSIADATRIFAEIFHTGSKLQAPLVSTGILLNAASAYLVPEARIEFGLASLGIASTAALTKFVMLPGINTLVDISESGNQAKVSKEAVVELLKAWRFQNYIRFGIAFTAGTMGLFAVMKRLNQSDAVSGRA